MELIKCINDFITNKLELSISNRLLVAVSGGRDSVLLVHVLRKLGWNIEIAHVNYQLRGAESDADEEFVRSLAKGLNVKVHIKKIDTLSYKKEHKLSTQEAARNIRYDWFDEVLFERDLDFVAVAQHKDDVLETQLINLSRGTGIKGLRAIQAKRDKVIRPFLCLAREDIDSLVQEMQLTFREDSSNQSDDYLRNKMRHHVIPALKKCEPKVVDQAMKTANILEETEEVLEELLEQKRLSLIVAKSDEYLQFSIEKLGDCSKSLLQFIFEKYGGFQSNEITALMHGQTGKYLENSSYTLLKDRDVLILKKSARQSFQKVLVTGEGVFQVGGQSLSVEEYKGDRPDFSLGNHNCYVPARLLQFPLTLRKWRAGDWIIPFGMKGKKLVSDLLVDLKLNRFQKEEVLILSQNEEIIWVLPCRSDERFKVVDASEKLYLFTLNIA